MRAEGSMGNRVAFIGLGVMGYPMAGHLARVGHQVTVFNRTRARAEDWATRHPGRAVATPAEAAAGAEMVLCCVGNDEQLAQVMFSSDGVLRGMSEGSLLIDHTTSSALIARELSKRAYAQGVGFIDAPVSGGREGAEQGVLSVMAGGRSEDFERAQPVIESYARCIRLLGPAGSGQLAKMANQICLAGVIQGLSEGLHFAEQAGLDPKAVVEVISQGAAQSWQMEHRSSTMIASEFDFGFAVDLMRKDLALALDEARHNGAKLPLTALVDQLYAEVQAMGGNGWDTSSLIQRLRGQPVSTTRP
jgi:3-hydroxyisobutyrate dehydrogenase-like beta-hydroxyacid dehydrogenase